MVAFTDMDEVAFTDMDDPGDVQERLAKMVELEEDIFIIGFHH
jgi:hypothetical protein